MLGSAVQFVQFHQRSSFTVTHPPVPPAVRVLVVDDDPALCGSLKRFLARRYDVAIAANGREGLELLARQPFDAVVSDVDMPVMDGLAFRAEIRRRHPELHDRVLIMSGGAPHWLRGDPTIRFIAKPFTIRELEETIEALLRR